jgi:hypothetical protein
MHQGTEEFGWYYCENLGSGDAEVDGGAEETCRVGINFSASAEEESATHGVKIQCLQEFTFEDPNCQENTAQACNDDIDNDGNGVWDCNGDMSGENPHRADRNCCVVDDRCEINPISYGADGICPDNSNSPGNHSDACITQVLRCCLQNVDDVDGGRPEICDLIEAELRSESE